MAIWQAGSPTSPSGAGWLGRWLDSVPDDPLRAISLEPVLPPFLVGDHAIASSVDRGGLDLPGGALGRAVRGLGAPDRDDGPWQARVATSVTHLQTLQHVAGGTVDHTRPQGDTELSRQLDTVAALVEARIPTRVYSVSMGGFDTHADERTTQQRLLGQLDGALAPFMTRMVSSPVGRQVVVLVYSEFGRRVRANASDGTDHGTAGPVFVLGHHVSGGFHGEQPSLANLDAGDLRASVDFRDIYASLAERVLDVDGERVVSSHPGRLGGILGAPVRT
jgi:uncharacterized protein (DUF1501 family)